MVDAEFIASSLALLFFDSGFVLFTGISVRTVVVTHSAGKHIILSSPPPPFQ